MGTARPLYKSFLSILQEELVPALGCTEPLPIAYAAAVAAHRRAAHPVPFWLSAAAISSKM